MEGEEDAASASSSSSSSSSSSATTLDMEEIQAPAVAAAADAAEAVAPSPALQQGGGGGPGSRAHLRRNRKRIVISAMASSDESENEYSPSPPPPPAVTPSKALLAANAEHLAQDDRDGPSAPTAATEAAAAAAPVPSGPDASASAPAAAAAPPLPTQNGLPASPSTSVGVAATSSSHPPVASSAADDPPPPAGIVGAAAAAAAAHSRQQPHQPQVDGAPPVDPPQSPQTRKRKAEQLEWMECPVCMEIPRRGPIYNCHNGHLICPTCQPQVRECPTCRDRDIDCRNLLAERLLESTLRDTPVPCQNHLAGCEKEDLVANLIHHEMGCYYRAVKCPAHHRNACHWTGPLSQLIKHVINNKCAQVVKEKGRDRAFTSTIGDFNQENMSVFDRPNVTHWKPVLLISPDTFKYFIYLIIYRDQQGFWNISARSYSHPDIVKCLEIEICLKKSGPKEIEPTDKSLTFVGAVQPSSASEKDVFASGEYFILKDAQVRRFSHDKTILEYTVKLRRYVKTDVGEIVREDIQPQPIALAAAAAATMAAAGPVQQR